MRRRLLNATGVFSLVILSAYFIFQNNELSHTNGKGKVLNFSRERLVRTHKMVPPFEAKLVADVTTPIPLNEVFVLEAQLQTSASLANLQYEWIVPEGIEILDYAPKGQLAKMNAGDEQTLKKSFRNLTTENKVILLSIKDGMQNFTAQFQTAQQDELIRQIEMIKENNAKYLEEHPEVLEKVGK